MRNVTVKKVTFFCCVLFEFLVASALQAEGQWFEPVNLHHLNADLAQLVEQLTCNQ